MKRFLTSPLVRLVLTIAIFVALFAGASVLRGGHRSMATSIVVTWIVVGLLLGAVALIERFATGRGLASIGLNPQHAARDLVLGLAFGAVLFCAVVAELAISGHFRITAFHLTWDLAFAILLTLAGAALEELFFRGVVFRLLDEWAGQWIALALSAVLFGAAHAFNPGATWVSTLAIALEAGVLLGAAYIVTNNLWFPIGLHFGWNYFEGPIFGTQVSGHASLASALTSQITGPAWLTGGTFGPEAGAGAIATSLIASILLLRYSAARTTR
jgi:membrane protease YdiL (CAAX protease family)